MSDRVKTEVWEYSKAKGATKLVLLVIADNANTETREGWPSPGLIAKYCGCQWRNVYNHLLLLEEMGEIEVREHTNWATTYRIRNYVDERGLQLNIYPEHAPRKGDIKKDKARIAAILARRPSPTPFEPPAYLRGRKRGKK